MSQRARIAIVGASGHTGGEVLRLVAGHPHLDLTVATARRAAGAPVTDVHPHLRPLAGVHLAALDPEAIAAQADVAVLALPHGESMAVAPGLVERGVRVVDLAGDFRLDAEHYPAWYGFEHAAPAWLAKAVYGLPELWGDDVAGADLVANPGCYPTAAILALAPLVASGAVAREGIVVDAKSGISGAGRTATDTTHFPHADASVRPYRPVGHQHVPEIERGLGIGGSPAGGITFVPHLVPMSRGILATCYGRVTAPLAAGEASTLLRDAYAHAPFVRVLPDGELPDTKRVQGTNAVELGVTVDDRTGTLVAVAALDNLVKGAAGQALQNVNLMFGWPETAGLEALAVYP